MEAVEKYLEDLHETWHGSPFSVGIVQRDGPEAAWQEHFFNYGRANGSGRMWDEDTTFSIASVSKHFVNTAIGLLVEDGTTLPNGNKLGWNTPIKDILEGWDPSDPVVREQCTVSDLASMRSGLPGHDHAIGDVDANEVLRLLPHLPCSTGFRQTFQYCNLGYFLLAHIIPTVTGISLEEFSQERIFKPLGMDNTSSDRDGNLKSGKFTDAWHGHIDMAKAVEAWEKHNKDGKEGLPLEMFSERRPFQYFNKGFKHFGPGPGHLLMPQRDMAKWMKELIDPKVIPKGVVARLSKPLTVSAGDGRPTSPEEGVTTYGLGLAVHTYRGHTVWQHGGGVPGSSSLMTVLPDKNLGIMAMSNDDNWGAALVKIIVYNAIDKILGLEPVDWQGRTIKEWMGYLAAKNPEFNIPDSPRPPLDAGIITGRFRHKGYGELNIVPLSDMPEVEELLPILRDRSNVVLPPSDEGMYVTVYKNIFTHYILFHHIDGLKYRYMTFDVYDFIPSASAGGTEAEHRGNEDVKKKKVVWVWLSGIAVFKDKGVGVFGGFNRRGAIEDPHQVTEENVVEHSDVWFGRL